MTVWAGNRVRLPTSTSPRIERLKLEDGIRIHEDTKAELEKSGKYKKPIATQVLPAGPFYRAEEYHQRYFEKNGGPACHVF